VSRTIETGFLLEPLEIPLSKLLPSARLAEGLKASPRFETIVASVQEVGIIEPLIVYPEKGTKGLYVVLDGHVRLEILKDLGRSSVTCLVAKDDESYTYNTHVSRVAPIQEVGMIRRAIAAGVSEERIAKALNLTTQTIRRNARRLKGICPEAVDILKDKPISEVALAVLRKVKPYRQIEMADLMARTGHYTSSYARTLLLRTPKDQCVAAPKDLRPEDVARLESESRSSEKEFVLATESHGKNVMDLMLLRTYMKKLLDNARVVKFMAHRKPELLRELQKVIEATSLEA
jgi:ParB-like chromosome segregation protein Spo0J